MNDIFEIPTARPGGFTGRLSALGLLVIDMQRDFLEPGGFGDALGNDVSLLQEAVPAVRRLLAAFRMLGLPVIHTVEGHKPDLSDCPENKRLRGRPGARIGDPGPMGRILVLGEPGNGIIPACAPVPGEKVVSKPGKGAFFSTDLEDFLRSRGITTLVVAGVTAEVCVQTTLREAMDRGFDVILVSDGTASYIPAFKEAVLEMVVSQGGIVGWTATSDQILWGILSQGGWEQGLTWTELRPGLQKASLGVAEDRWEAAFLSYAPGGQAPRHRHTGTERILMLRGTQEDARGVYHPGTTVVNLPGTDHEVWSDGGCLLFISWDSPVEFL